MGESRFFKIKEQDIRRLREQWRALLGEYSSDEDEINRLFESVARHYSEKGRFYHNLSHIKALLESSDSIKSIRDLAAVRLAIWFHDVIYDTRKNDNEEQSAEMAAGFLDKLSVPTRTISAARDMILATKSHEADFLSQDAKVFLDLDLSILGASEEVYKAYSEAIRKEYAWVPGFLYRRGRKKILESFLRREAIFQTDEMAARLETQARHNIENELGELSN